MEERARILKMVSEGTITAEEAGKLLDALAKPKEPQEAGLVLKDRRGRKPTKFRVDIDAGEHAKKARVNVNIPISVIRTLGPVIARNMPHEAQEELDRTGVDLVKIIAEIDNFLSESSDDDIVNIVVNENGEDTRVRVYVE